MEKGRRYVSFVAAIVLLLPGCARRPVKPLVVCAVNGNISYNGTPPAGAVVTFHPVPRDDDPPAVAATPPEARVAADGTFSVADGVRSGEYALTVTWHANAASTDRLRGQYNDPQSPILWVTIDKRENQLPLIELTGPPVNVDDVMGTEE